MKNKNSKVLGNKNGVLKDAENIVSFPASGLLFSEKLKKLSRRKRKQILKDRDISKKTLDEAFSKHLFRQKLLKNIFNVKNAVAFTVICAVLSYPLIYQSVLERKINQMEVEDHAPVERFVEVEKDEKGEIVEKPISNQELVDAFDFFCEKIFDDIDFLGEEAINFDSIEIYNHNLFSKNNSLKDSKVHLVLRNSDECYVLEYTALEEDFENGFEVLDGLNDAEQLLSLMTTLQNCYPSNFIKINSQKEEIASSLETILHEKAFVCEPFAVNEGTLETEYHIPVYTNSLCKVFSISEYSLSENSMDMSNEAILNLLGDYLNNKNEFFNERTVDKIENSENFSLAYANGLKNKQAFSEEASFVNDELESKELNK